MTDHIDRLRKGGEAYQQAREEAERLVAEPRDQLVEAAREAYADGMKKADIKRHMNHVWSDTWIDKILKGVKRKTDESA